MRKLAFVFILSVACPGMGVTEQLTVGEIREIPISLANPGDSAILDSGSFLRTTSTAITLSAAQQKVFNSGTIDVVAGSARGIFSNGSLSYVENQGVIAILGDNSYGIYFQNSIDSSLVNKSQVATMGSYSHAINIESSIHNQFINSGSVYTSGGLAHAVLWTKGSDFGEVSNTGLLKTDGANSQVIAVDSNYLTITNTGRILATGQDSAAIFVSGSSFNTTIINSGVLGSSQHLAIDSLGTNTTLSLLRGSRILGGIGAGSSPLNVQIEKGLNLRLNLSSGSFGNVSSDTPYVVVGHSLATADRTPFTLQADVAADFSDVILNGIYHHRRGCCSCSPFGDQRPSFWAAGLGSYRRRDEGKNYLGYENNQGGFLVGYDHPLLGGYGGVAGGISFAKANIDYTDPSTEITDYFGAMSYEKEICCRTLLGLAVAVGYVNWESSRFIMNNLAQDGIEEAKSDFNGSFVTSELSLSSQFCVLMCQPRLSFVGRYAGLFFGDYSEKGSGTNLFVKDRQVDLLTTRLECSLPWTFTSCTGRTCFEPFIGVLGRFQVGGNNIDAQLLGESFSFEQGGPRNLAAFVAGFYGVQTLRCFNLFLNFEGGFDSQDSYRLLGSGGISWNF